MKKFRKWLIHKLGGICEDDIVQPKIVTQEKHTQMLVSEITFGRLNPQKNAPREHINHMLIQTLSNDLIHFVKFKEIYTNNEIVYRAYLEVVA